MARTAADPAPTTSAPASIARTPATPRPRRPPSRRTPADPAPTSAAPASIARTPADAPSSIARTPARRRADPVGSGVGPRTPDDAASPAPDVGEVANMRSADLSDRTPPSAPASIARTPAPTAAARSIARTPDNAPAPAPSGPIKLARKDVAEPERRRDR